MNEFKSLETFTQFADKYLLTRENEFNNSSQLEFLAESIQPIAGKNVLELGCGGGVPILKYFYDRKANVTGIDFCDKMIQRAKLNLPKANLVLADITQSPLPHQHYDLIISFYTIFVLELSQQFFLFEKIYQSLKPGGKTYFTLLSKAATQQEEFSGFLPFMDHIFYYAHTTIEKYHQKLTSIGFKRIAWEEIQIGHEICLWVFAEK